MNTNVMLNLLVNGLVDASAKSAVVLLAATALVLFLRPKSAAVRHLVWTLAVGMSVLMPVFSFVLPGWRVNLLPPLSTPAPRPSPVAAAQAAPVVAPFVSVPKSELQNSTPVPFERPSRQVSQMPIRSADSSTTPDLAAPPGVPAPAPIRRALPHSNDWHLARWIASIWAAGAAAIGVTWLLGIIAIRLSARRATCIDSGSLHAMLRDLADELHLRRSVRLLLSNTCPMPMAWGLVQPHIMLPSSAALWPPERARGVLLHELSHVRRWDCATQLLAHLARAVYWFNPFAWWAHNRMRAEQERACDDAVLSHGAKATAYAEDLVVVARTLQAGRLTSIAAVAMARHSHLHTRVRAILDGEMNRRRPTRRLILFGALVAAGVLLPLSALHLDAVQPQVMAADAVSAATQQAATQQSVRQIKVTVVRGDTNEPLPGTQVWCTAAPEAAVRYGVDNKGECMVPIAANARQVRFEIVHDNFVQYWITFGTGPRTGPNTGPIPDSFITHMLPGVTVGGNVHDETGKAVEGVKVLFESAYDLPDHPGQMSSGNGVATTDAAGHWTFNGAPQKPTRLYIVAQHPDFVLSNSHQDVRPGEYEKVRNQTWVTVIRRGLSVSGVVLDTNGQPIAMADVAQDNFGIINGTKSDKQGKFQLRGVAPGPRQLLAKGDGYVAQSIKVEAAQDTQPVEFRLSKGRLLEGRIVNSKGEPIPNATVSIEKSGDIAHLSLYLHTDADGRFSWNGAPADAVTAAVSKDGFARKTGLVLTAGQVEAPIVLTPSTNNDPFGGETVMTVRGNVVDDQTGQPVPKFKALVKSRRNVTPNSYWTGNAAGANGKYEVPMTRAGDTYTVRIDSDDYLPLESEPILHQQAIEFNTRLKKGRPITGVVLTPDGLPAKGADVALRERFMVAVADGRIDTMRSSGPEIHLTTADAAGHFTLPPREGNAMVFAVHESGWAEWLRDGQGEGNPVKLHEWASVEGTIRSGDKPVAGRIVQIQGSISGRLPTNPNEQSARFFFNNEATTDEGGRFSFDRVLDGPSRLSVQDGSDNVRRDGISTTLSLVAGEHRVLRLGGIGRPVIGKVSVPDDLKDKVRMPSFGTLSLIQPAFIPPPGYEKLDEARQKAARQEFQKSAAYQKYLNSETSLPVTVNADGTFRADDVPAGEYMLSISVHADKPDASNFVALIAAARMAVTVPEMPGGRSDQPLDLSKMEFEPYRGPGPQDRLTLTRFKEMKVGEPAPEFQALTYDGKKISLADLRGKIVMIDFWATWCGPCIVEMAHLERLNAQLRNDPRLVMVSISLDDRIQEPTRFLQNRKLPWTQWYGGASGPQSAFEEFGIHAIPSVWIIDPQGKIIARDLYGETVEPALEKALAAK